MRAPPLSLPADDSLLAHVQTWRTREDTMVPGPEFSGGRAAAQIYGENREVPLELEKERWCYIADRGWNSDCFIGKSQGSGIQSWISARDGI
jgi:hypothetical protein